MTKIKEEDIDELQSGLYIECKNQYEIKQSILKNQEIVERLRKTDNSIYEECLETIEKIQFGKELDSWDSANLDTIERLLKSILNTLTEK